jgi:hypothetical protein
MLVEPHRTAYRSHPDEEERDGEERGCPGDARVREDRVSRASLDTSHGRC